MKLPKIILFILLPLNLFAQWNLNNAISKLKYGKQTKKELIKICQETPFTQSTINKVYDRIKSIEKTKLICNDASILALHPFAIVATIERFTE